jgi:hypothetical protein
MRQQTINNNTIFWVLDLKSQKKFCEHKVFFLNYKFYASSTIFFSQIILNIKYCKSPQNGASCEMVHLFYEVTLTYHGFMGYNIFP